MDLGCYFSSNKNIEGFEVYLNTLESETRRNIGQKFIVMEDFNAKSPPWATPRECSRGDILKFFAALTLTFIRVVSHILT